MIRSRLAAPLALALLPALALGAPQPKDQAAPGRTRKMAFELKSPAFSASTRIPKDHTGEGKDASPALSWTGAPAGTKSFALIMDDPDAPVGLWIHWVMYDIPGTVHSLPEGLAKIESLPDGAKQGLCWAVRDADCDRVGYYGPLPPPGKPHRYFFKLYALDAVLNLPPKTTKGQVVAAMKGRILGEAQLIGLYER